MPRKPPLLLEDIIWLFEEDQLSEMLEQIDNFLEVQVIATPQDTETADKLNRARDIIDKAFRDSWLFEGNPPEDSELRKRRKHR